MSEKRYPDRNQQSESEHGRDHKPDPDQPYVDDDLRLWGPESEEEPTHYGDLRDQSFQAGSTSQPASMGEESKPERGWQAEDAPRQKQTNPPDPDDEQERREKAIQQTTKDHTP
jgi:hypothetical protein